VVQCTDAEHVVAGLEIAREFSIPVSVRGGGHNSAGLALRGGGLLFDCSAWKNVGVDPVRRQARSAPGATWGDFDAATQQYGLATPGGVVSTTGVAGLTLGGGIGALRGKHGLTCDNLRSAEVVLADGSRVVTDAEHDGDLLWALRGGGSNFGIVVSFDFELHPAERVVTGFMTYPIDEAQEVLSHYWGRAAQLPDNCAVEFLFMHDQQGLPVLRVVPRFIGTLQEGRPVLDPLRVFRRPEDSLREYSYCESQRFLDPGSQWGLRALWRTRTLKTFEPQAIEALVEWIKKAPSPRCMVVVEHLQGEIGRIDAASAAVSFRQAAFNLMMVAQWVDPADDQVNHQWVKELAACLAPLPESGAYINYLGADATPEDVKKAYGAYKYEMLQRIKAKYDPENVFRCNQNISPSAKDSVA